MMPTRRDKAAAKRRAHHQRRLEQAATDRDALWVACAWLVAEAARAGRLAEATRVVLGLVHAMRDGAPVTARVFDSNFEPGRPGDQRVPNAGVSARAGARPREISNYSQ